MGNEITSKEIPKKIVDKLFTPKEQNIINKFKKWGIIIAVCLVVGYAAYRMFLG